MNQPQMKAFAPTTREHDMTRKLRIDGLGRETQFIMPDSHMTDYSRLQWEHKLTGMVLGYTKIAAAGGWRGIEEPITIYRVAGLNSAHADIVMSIPTPRSICRCFTAWFAQRRPPRLLSEPTARRDCAALKTTAGGAKTLAVSPCYGVGHPQSPRRNHCSLPINHKSARSRVARRITSGEWLRSPFAPSACRS